MDEAYLMRLSSQHALRARRARRTLRSYKKATLHCLKPGAIHGAIFGA